MIRHTTCGPRVAHGATRSRARRLGAQLWAAAGIETLTGAALAHGHVFTHGWVIAGFATFWALCGAAIGAGQLGAVAGRIAAWAAKAVVRRGEGSARWR